MTYRRVAKAATFLRLFLLAGVLGVSTTGTSLAANHPFTMGSGAFSPRPAVTLSQLEGHWAFMEISAGGGCGVATVYGTIDLNASGSGAWNETTHSAGCGNVSASDPFTITSLNSNGSGTANYTCGSGCGFTFDIQVSPNHQEIAMVDITDANQYPFAILVKQ
jgi:hypothetical protein